MVQRSKTGPETSPSPNPDRFTITDYTYSYGEEQELGQDHSTSTLTPPARAKTTPYRSPLDLGAPLPKARQDTSSSQGSGSGNGTGSGRSLSGIRPLPRIPSTSTTLSEQPEAGPSSSPIISSPTAMSPTSPRGYAQSPSKTLTAGSSKSPSSSAAYYTPPHTARTFSGLDKDRKGKQPENIAGTQTRPGRNGSGGSSRYKLQLHEAGPFPTGSGTDHMYSTPLPSPNDVSRVSTEIDPLPSVHHSVYTQGTNDRDHEWGDKDHHHAYGLDGDEKDIYAAPALNRNQSETKQVGGFWRRIVPSTWVCRLLILVVILESLVDLAILANILWRFNHAVKSDQSSELIWQNKRRLPVYLIIFGLAHLWQTILTCIAIKGKNTMQVVALTIFNYAFLGYAVMMIYELRKILGDLNTSLQTVDPEADTDEIFTIPLNVLTAVLIVVIAVGCVILSVLAYFIRREFGWQKYRFLGADLQIRKLYQRFQVFECICYFAAFFCCGFGIQFIWLVLQKTDVEYIITWVMFPLLLLLLIFGRFAAKYEKKWMMVTFLIGILCGLAYFTFKLVRIWQQEDTVYANLSLSLTVFDALSILSLAACGSWAIWVGSGFGQGLKQAVLPTGGTIITAMRVWRTKSVDSDVEMKMSDKEKEAQVTAQRRISID